MTEAFSFIESLSFEHCAKGIEQRHLVVEHEIVSVWDPFRATLRKASQDAAIVQKRS